MPFTLSHPAAALPVRRLLPWLPLDALMVGAMAPDFEYLLRLAARGGMGHFWPGIVLFSLPAGLLVLAAFRVLVRPALLSLLHPHLHQAFETRAAGYRWRRPAVTVAAVQLGVLTHVAWDGFTHGTGWAVVRLPALLEPAAAVGTDRAWYSVLQHGSSLLGAVVLLLWAVSWIRAHGGLAGLLPPRRSRRAAGLCLLVGSVALAGAAANGARVRGSAPEQVLGYAAVGGMAAGALALLGFGVAHRLREGAARGGEVP